MDRQEGISVIAHAERPRIAVIDHDAVVRATLRAHLTRARYEVLCAQDAIGGAHLMVEVAPSLVICEARLPQVNGYEFASALRADPLTRGIPVVLLTTKGLQPDLARLGIVACLARPVVPERLLRIVAEFARPRIASAGVSQRTGAIKTLQAS